MKGFLVFSIYIVGVFFCFSSLAQKNDPKTQLAFLTARAFETYLNTPDSAIFFTKKAIDIALKTKDTYYEGQAYFILSKTYWVKANYRLSTEYGFKALKVFENSPHKKEWALSLLSVGRTLTELGNYSKAGELMVQSLKLSMQESDNSMLAETYREFSYLLAEEGQLDSALVYADKGIALFEKSGDSLDASVLYGRKSRIFFLKKDFLQSRKFAFRGILMDTLVGNRRALGVAYFSAAQNEHALKNLPNAERLLKHSIRISHEIGNLTWLVRAHELMANIYLDTKKSDLAVVHLQLANHYQDSLYNSEKSGQVQEMQSLYELEGKENTIKLLEQENALRQQEVKNQQLLLTFLLVGMLLLVLLLFLLARLRGVQTKTNRDLSAKNIAIEQQKEEMQTQAEKLQQLNHLQTKLFSVISHDLRGPISNLQSLLELFTKKLLTAEELVFVSDKLKANLNVTQSTLENLLNWALSQMDGIKTEKKKIEVASCIDEACYLMEEVALRKTVSLQKRLNGSLLVWADPDQVQLVLRNLIHNGIKFSKIGDQLIVSASKENGCCRITIQDSGIGMSKEEIHVIQGSTEHFTKVGTQQEKGTGLGLLLCKEFIERNGGSFDIKSKYGEGTEVSFTLSLA